MTDKEKEAIQTFEFFLDDISKNGGCTIDIDFQHKKEYEAMWKIVNLIPTQQEEIEKKDKIIDEMVKYISDLDIDEDICMKNVVNTEICNEEYSNCKECIKEYFINKVEKENKDE